MIDLKEEIITIAHKIYERNLTIGSGGNISLRTNDGILITPSGIPFYELTSSDIITVDYNGNVKKGAHKPSSEALMHIEIYKTRKDINAIIHVHPPLLTGLSICRIKLDFFHPEQVVYLGNINYVEYVTPTTQKLAMKVKEAVKDSNFIILFNHGIVSLGENIDEAFYRIEILENLLKSLAIAKIFGTPVSLSFKAVQDILILNSEKYRRDTIRERRWKS